MQHALDEAPERLCAALLDQSDDLPSLREACAMAGQAWDGDLGRPRGPRAALTLADMKADADTLLAACLADPRLEPALDEKGLHERFGPRVAHLVADVRRLRDFCETQAPSIHQTQAENLRRLLLSMADDARSLLILLALQLERLRALPWVEDEEARRRVALMTLGLFAPLAHRLGLGQLKWELEDLAFRQLEPETYKRIARFLDERRAEREAYIARVRDALQRALDREGIVASVYGRPKHIYSIFGKMQRKRLSFEQLFDVRALRVQVEDIADCYAALGIVHTLWDPIPGEYDDYIAHPKPNGYQSLHTAVHALEGKALEVQIRTRAMHEQAELGVAAHWRYKEGGAAQVDPFQEEMRRLRLALGSLHGVQPEDSTPGEAMLEEGATPAARHVYVFTPKGEVMELPRGATPLDLAYAIHTELGHACKGAKVNGRLVPLNTPLENADRVELMRAPQGSPSREWADPKAGYLQSKSARAKVRAWFLRRERESAREEGRGHWERTVRRLGLSRMQRERLLGHLHLKSEEAAWEALGEGRLSRADFLEAARAVLAADGAAERTPSPPPLLAPEAPAHSLTLDGLQAEPARCCNPAPGDAVVGFITRGHGLRLHRADCRNLAQLRQRHPERIMALEWPRLAGVPIRLHAEVLGEDSPDLLRDVGHVLAQFKARLVSSDSRLDRRSGQVRLRLSLDLPEVEGIGKLLSKLEGLRTVDAVHRL